MRKNLDFPSFFVIFAVDKYIDYESDIDAGNGKGTL